MKPTFIKFLLASVFSASFVFAQASGTGPGTGAAPTPANFVQRRVEHLTTILSLTTDQQQQATTIFTNAANTAAGLRDSMNTAHQNLSTAVKNNDATGIDLAATTIGNLTTQLTAANAKADAAFYHILTSDQQTKFNALHGGHGDFGGRGGPGGFRGGRPPR